jgi:hypothetical protein
MDPMMGGRRLAIACVGSLALAACGSTGNGPADAGRDTSADSFHGDGVEAPDAGDAPTVATDAGPDARDGSYADDGPCMPGVPRCHGDFGYQMCQQDGTWGESSSCAGYSMNGTTSYCAELPMAGGGTWGTCVDPACWYWLGRGALGGPTPVGICEPDGTMQVCDAGGTLSPASCAGACTPVTTLDGRAVGYCAPACQDGARECLGGPFYRVCAGGQWSAETQACDAGACNPVATGATPDVRCGGACDPGTSRCRADGAAVEICVPGGTWTTDRTCLLGRCRPAGPQAECETECPPGSHGCAFDGAGAERACGADGLWQAEAACAPATSCRFAGAVALGCVACVGGGASGGNAFGAADGRCGADGGVETCGPNNQWQADVACAGGETCASLTRSASTIAACAAP